MTSTRTGYVSPSRTGTPQRSGLARAIRSECAGHARSGFAASRTLVVGLCLIGAPALAELPAVIDLASLNGSNGFAIDGASAPVNAAGDVNGDGFADVVVGGLSALYNAESYVIFGGDMVFPARVDVMSLDGQDGFHLLNSGGDSSRKWASGAGDLNDDGVDDLVFGDRFVLNNDPPLSSGEGISRVLYGRGPGHPEGFAPSIDLATLLLDGTSGFTLRGVQRFDMAGYSVSAVGDVNGDAIDDAIIGAPGVAIDGFDFAGQAFVVFGRDGSDGAAFPTVFELAGLDGRNGFTVQAATGNNSVGRAVRRAGDINGDGIDDVVVGAPTDSSEGHWSGRAYVVFGRETASAGDFPPVIEMSALNGGDGFAITGEIADSRAGYSVSDLGDVNGDGIDDVLVGTYAAGLTYVVFGRDTARNGAFPAEIKVSSLDGRNGFAIRDNGTFGDDNVSGAGDFNGDGIADILVGDGNDAVADKPYAGKTYVVFGRDSANAGDFPAEVDLSRLDAGEGIVIYGANAYQQAGVSVSGAGDVNGDGVSDVIIGSQDGEVAYVVFGGAEPVPPSLSGYIDVTGLADVNGNGSRDMAVLRDFVDGTADVLVLDGATGAQAGAIPVETLPTSATGTLKRVVGLTTLADIDGSGTPEVAVLLRRTDGSGRVHIKDSRTGQWLGKLRFFGPGWQVRGIAAHDTGGSAAVSVLARRDDSGAVAIQIVDVAARTQVSWIELPISDGSTYVDIDSVADIDRNGTPEVAVLETFPDATARVVVFDTASGARVNTLPVETLPTSPTGVVKAALAIAGIEDLNGNGTGDVAMLLRQRDGEGRVHFKDGASGQWLGKLRVFDHAWAVRRSSQQWPDAAAPATILVLGSQEDGGDAAVEVFDVAAGVRLDRLPLP